MDAPARIELPAAPRSQWSRSAAVWLALAVTATVVLGATAAITGHPAALASAGGGLALVLLLLLHAVATVGRVAWVLAERVDAPPTAKRVAEAVLWPVALGAVATIMGFVLASAAPRVQAIAPAIAAAGILLSVVSIGGRMIMVRAARALVVRLQRTTLAELDRGGGHLELEVTIPADAPTIEVPFLQGEWAAVELLVDDTPYAWPERVPVRDATATAELDLATCSLAGWRFALDTISWASADKRPPVAEALRAAAGRDGKLGADSAVVLYIVRALAPGDKLYVIGDATDVRRGFGYRAEGQVRVGDASGRPALVYLGDEAWLRGKLAHELRWLPLLALLGGVGLALLAAAIAVPLA